VRDALEPGVARAWRLLADRLPDGLYLIGGSAVGVRLRIAAPATSTPSSAPTGSTLTPWSASSSRWGSCRRCALRAPFACGWAGRRSSSCTPTRAGRQEQLAPPEEIARIPVAALEDLMATKLKVLGERGEVRDDFDEDAPDDDNVPMPRAERTAWWRKRQARLLREGF